MLRPGALLYLDCFSGVAGDMFIAALVDLGVPWEPLACQLRRLELPQPFDVELGRRRHHGLQGADFRVLVEGSGAGARGSYAEIRRSYRRLAPPAATLERAETILSALMAAHERVSGLPATELELVGEQLVDTAVDVLGAALALEALAPARVRCRPIPVGQGRPHRGSRLPIPSPLALELLRGASVWGGGESKELCTPTGAAIVAATVEGYGELPAGRLLGVGYGAGDVSLEDRPNHLRAILLDEGG